MKTFSRLVVLALFLALVGCATVRSVKVDAIASTAAAPGTAFHIVPASPNHAENDLRFIEASKILARALTDKGFHEAADAAGADLVIALDYTVSEPRSVAVTRTEPVYDAGFYSYARVPVRMRGGVAYVRAAYWNPGPVVCAENTYTATVYDKLLSITAFAAKPGNNGDLPQLWSVIVSSREGNSDIRAALPSLAVAAVRNIGRDTHGQIVVTVKADEPEVVHAAPAVPEK